MEKLEYKFFAIKAEKEPLDLAAKMFGNLLSQFCEKYKIEKTEEFSQKFFLFVAEMTTKEKGKSTAAALLDFEFFIPKEEREELKKEVIKIARNNS
jgi:hypothetical protein